MDGHPNRYRKIGEICSESPALEQIALSISRRVEIEERSLRILAQPLEYRIVQDPRDEFFSVRFVRSAAGEFGDLEIELCWLCDFLAMEPIDPGAESGPEVRLRAMLTNTTKVHGLLLEFDDRRWRDLYWYARGRNAQYASGYTEQCYGC